MRAITKFASRSRGPEMLNPLMFIILILGMYAIFGLPGSAQAQVSCPGMGWSNTSPSINLEHIFCGEMENGEASGFHARPGRYNPVTVDDVVVVQRPNLNGIYGVTVTLIDAKGEKEEKFSTMFPDDCTQEEIENSILYAVHNQKFCPLGAPGWAKCGYNRPERRPTITRPYCSGDLGERFIIAMGISSNGSVNTAFPLR